MIKIVSESSIAAGIRRIEAITGEMVENSLHELQDTLKEVADLLNTHNVIQAIQKTVSENASLKKEAENMIQERIKTVTEQVLKNKITENGINIFTLYGPRISEMAKGVAFNVREASPENSIFVAATIDKGKPMLTVMVTNDLVKEGYNASTIVREAAKLIQGGGGGQPQFAQAGGKNADGISAALDKMIALIKNK